MSSNHIRSKLSAKKRRKQTPHKISSPPHCISPSSHSIDQQHSMPSNNSSFNTTTSTPSYTSSSSQKTCEELLASSRAHLLHVAVPQTSSILVTGLPFSEFTTSEDQDHHQAYSNGSHSRRASTISTKKASSSISPRKDKNNTEKESQLEDTVAPKTNIRDYYRKFGKVSKFVINPKGLLTPVIGNMNISTNCFHKDICDTPLYYF